MAKNATKQDVLVSLGELDKLAGKYEQTAKTLRQLSRALRSVTEGIGEGKASEKPAKAPRGRKRVLQRVVKPSVLPLKRKPMSAAKRKALSEALKARWAEKKAQEAA